MPRCGTARLTIVHADHLGTPRAITEPASGEVVWRWKSDPFGRAKAAQDPDGDGQVFAYNLRFPGQYYDAETGKHYNYFRNYESNTGRYIQADPIGLDGGINPLAYALSNAVNNSDPLGLWVKVCARKLGGPDEKPVSPSGNPLRHDYLSVSGQTLSFQMGSNMFWSQGEVKENEKPSNPKCRMVCEDDRFDKYVKKAATKIGEPTYCVAAYPGTTPHLLGARNCQTWAKDVVSLAKEMYKEKVQCPDCFK